MKGIWSSGPVALAVLQLAGLASSSAALAGEELLLRFGGAVDTRDRVGILSGSGMRVIREFPEIGAMQVEVVDRKLFKSRAPSLRARLEYLERNGTVRVNDLVSPALRPNDKFYKEQGRMREMDVEKAWEVTTGSKDVVVAVSDTGMSQKHPDLADELWTNPKPGEGGFKDDLHGWNFYRKSNNPEDDHGHGSHVSGIIGAVGDNGIGVAGVNWHVTIMPVKFLSATGSGSTADGIATILYAVDHGARLINCSWGGDDFSQAMLDAINYAYAHGTLVIAAAGNDGRSTDYLPQYPGAYDSPGLITVASSEWKGRLSFFSNSGQLTVDVVAPGQDILSTYSGKGYMSLMGTSMATPMVTGVAALILSVRPDLSPNDLRNAVLNAAVHHKDYDGYISTAGDLSADRAVRQLSEGFQVWPRRLTLKTGGSHRFTAWSPEGEVKWSVKPETMGTVDPDGTLHVAKTEGVLTLVATDASGHEAATEQITAVDDPHTGGGCSRKRGEVPGDPVAQSLSFGLPMLTAWVATRRRRK